MSSLLSNAKINPEYYYHDFESENFGEYNKTLKKEIVLRPGDLEIIQKSVLQYTKDLELRNDLSGVIQTSDLLSHLNWLCRSTVVLLILIVFLSGCKKTVKPHPPAFVFDYPILIQDLDESSCYTGVLEEGIESVGQLEARLLAKFADKVTPEELQRASEAYHEHVLRSFTLVSSKKDSLFLVGILQKLIAQLDSLSIPHPKHKLFLISSRNDEPFINAFTTGAYIYFSTDMLEFLARDKDEVATILGHELAHTYLGHCSADQMRARIAAEILGDNSLSRGLASFYSHFLLTPIGQANEMLCDMSSAHLMYLAGFDPGKCTAPYYRMAEQMKYRDRSIFRLLDSHPMDEVRLSCVASSIERARIRSRESVKNSHVNN